ncbi:MAG: 5'-3' exonuclease H3TH domain-containing protein [Pseudomonadota bacterium]
MTTKTVYLIDASIYVFRAYFSVPDSLRGMDGQPVNAAYGFTRFLAEFCEKSNADYVGVAFDESLTTSFRNDIYPQYKMNRELPPEELKTQFALCRRIAEAAGLFCAAHDQYEADDLIATMSQQMRQAGFRTAVVSGDKDLTQLLRDKDFWWDFARGQQLDSAGVEQKFGVPPENIQDFLGLCGDAVDNIPGVPGVGPKTATALLQAFGTLESVYDNLDQIESLAFRGAKTMAKKIAPHESQALLSKQLATVSYEAPVQVSGDILKRGAPAIGEFKELSQLLGGRGEGLFQRLVDGAK